MKQGEVYWADLVRGTGSEQAGRRPVILVSHDGFSQAPGWRSMIVVPISTSSSQGKRVPTVIDLTGGTGGLAKTSFAICHQVTTLVRAKLTTRLGMLPSESLHEVEEGLKAAVQFRAENNWLQSGHVSNFFMPIGAVIEPVDGDCFQSNTRELLAGVRGGHPDWTGLELAEAAGATSRSHIWPELINAARL